MNEKLHVEGVTKSDAAVSVLTDRLLELTDYRSEQALVRVLKIKDRKLSQNMVSRTGSFRCSIDTVFRQLVSSLYITLGRSFIRHIICLIRLKSKVFRSNFMHGSAVFGCIMNWSF